jgi:sulfoacetaldehyde acetyltransferase
LGLTKRVDVAVCGDARLAAVELLALLQARRPQCHHNANERIQNANQVRSQWESELDAISCTAAGSKQMAPRHALRELERAMPKVRADDGR